MHKRKILVVTATIGTRDTLERTINSVKTIGGDDVFHVIVAPEHVISTLQERYPDMTCISEDKSKRGIYAALNMGFQTYGREYEYMTFINDDDYWLPDYRVLIDEVLKDGSTDFVFGKVEYVNEAGSHLAYQSASRKLKDFIPLLHSNIVLFTQQSTILKSSIYFELGGFDESYKLVADSKFWAQLSLKDIKAKFINKFCAAYTIQEGQLSSDSTTQAREHNRMLTELPTPSFMRQTLALVSFRTSNIPVYIKRFIRNEHI